jgi:hypothetical protein
MYRRVILGPRMAWLVKRLAKPFNGWHLVDALTIGHTVLFLSGEPPRDLERHEFEHVMQAIRMEPAWWPRWLGRRYAGIVRYWAAYAVEWLRVGYEDNRFEVEARRAAALEVKEG